MKLFNLFKKKEKSMDSLMWFYVNMDTVLKIMYDKGYNREYEKMREKKKPKKTYAEIVEDMNKILNRPCSLYEIIENEQKLDTWIRKYMGVKKK